MTRREFESKRISAKEGGKYWIDRIGIFCGEKVFRNISNVKWLDDGISFTETYDFGESEKITLARKYIKSITIYHVNGNSRDARQDYRCFRRNIQEYEE